MAAWQGHLNWSESICFDRLNLVLSKHVKLRQARGYDPGNRRMSVCEISARLSTEGLCAPDAAEEQAVHLLYSEVENSKKRKDLATTRTITSSSCKYPTMAQLVEVFLNTKFPKGGVFHTMGNVEGKPNRQFKEPSAKRGAARSILNSGETLSQTGSRSLSKSFTKIRRLGKGYVGANRRLSICECSLVSNHTRLKILKNLKWCTHCDGTFFRVQDVINHMVTEHPGKLLYHCAVENCDAEFESAGSNIRGCLIFSRDEKFKTPFCSDDSLRPQGFTDEVRQLHTSFMEEMLANCRA